MKRRRVAFIAAVQYETPLEKLERIPYIVQEIVQPLQDITLDRVHLKDVGGGSLNYEIVYYVETPDVYRYMDLQQSINLELLRRFAQEGIEFAYPTQAVITAKTK
jgi:small-conductance mechanosensitive channel